MVEFYNFKYIISIQWILRKVLESLSTRIRREESFRITLIYIILGHKKHDIQIK